MTKISIFAVFIAMFLCLTIADSHAQIDDTGQLSRNIIIEDLPSLTDITKVSASKTPSGFPVPRYVSLKFDRVNGRTGPSTSHPKAWEYQREGLPLVVVAEMDIWRKVRDMHGDESWVRTYALTGQRHVVTLDNIALRAKPRNNARAVALADKNAVLELDECSHDGWCRVSSKQGHKGWAPQRLLWGAKPL